MQNETVDLYHHYRVACAVRRITPGHQAESFGLVIKDVRQLLRASKMDDPAGGSLRSWIRLTLREFFAEAVGERGSGDAGLRARLLALIKARGWSLRKVADPIGKNHGNISQWLRGCYAGNVPNLEKAIREFVEREGG